MLATINRSEATWGRFPSLGCSVSTAARSELTDNPETLLLKALATRQDRPDDTEYLYNKRYDVGDVAITLGDLAKETVANCKTKEDVRLYRFNPLLTLEINEWRQNVCVWFLELGMAIKRWKTMANKVDDMWVAFD